MSAVYVQMWSHRARKSPGRVSQGMRESPYKAASSRWPTAATDRAQTNKTTRESNEMHLKTRRKHWCFCSLSPPHWFKVMPWTLTLLNFQGAHTWGPKGLPQRQESPGRKASSVDGRSRRDAIRSVSSAQTVKTGRSEVVPDGTDGTVRSDVQEF